MLSASLAQLYLELCVLGEGNLHVEHLERVDGVLVARTVDSFEFLVGSLGACTASLALGVMAFAAWSVASVRRGPEGPRVGLHDIELGAPLVVDHVGVAIEIASPATARIAVPVQARHPDQVQSCIAAAARSRQVNIVLDGASEEINSIEIVWSVGVAESQVASAAVWDVHGVAALGMVPLLSTGNVECLILSIFLNIDGWEGSGGAQGERIGRAHV